MASLIGAVALAQRNANNSDDPGSVWKSFFIYTLIGILIAIIFLVVGRKYLPLKINKPAVVSTSV
jgi:hypothetical protein